MGSSGAPSYAYSTALIAVWIIVGAFCAAWLAAQLTRRGRFLTMIEDLALMGLVLLGPFSVLAILSYLLTRPRSRVRS